MVTPSPAPAADGKKFESKDGNFSIDIFQAPFQTRQPDPPPNDKNELKAGEQFLWRFEKTVYTVMYMEFAENELSRAFEDMNSGGRKGIARQGGRLIYEKEISFGKYPGREFRVIMPNGVTQTARNYLVGNMGYLLTAGYVDERDEKEALKILNSFKLLTEKK